jgi:hypothetical protein
MKSFIFSICTFFVLGCSKSMMSNCQKHIVIIAGQSQAVGRANNNELPNEITNYQYKRTYIWINTFDSTQLSWPNFNIPNYKQINGWDFFDLKKNQSFNQELGQHGIEPYLAYNFEKKFPNDTLYLVKFAYGGIPLNNNPNFLDWSPNSKNEMYFYFVNKYLKPTLENLPNAKLDCIYWAQGETDAQTKEYANNYYTNLNEFYYRLFIDVPTLINTPKVILQCKNYDPLNAPYTNIVRQAQQKFCNESFNMATLINCDSIPTNKNDIHYSSQGYKFLALELIKLINAN